MAEIEASQNRLLVVEFNGTPRSGKGTITSALGQRYLGSATDETGADYRAVTWGLLQDGLIDPSMTEEEVLAAARKLNEDTLVDYAARRWEIELEHGKETLYNPEINNVVGVISPLHLVRSAVKGGFVRRLKQTTADPETGLLFVDGRNLHPLIEKVQGAEVLLRLFVECSDSTAAQRETAREVSLLLQKGQLMTDEERDDHFNSSLTSIASRRLMDQRRSEDPVKVDAGSMQYWHNRHILRQTALDLSKRLGITTDHARQMIQADYYRGGRRGVGSFAFKAGRQVVFDTNSIPRDEMIDLCRDMVEEALAEVTA